MVEQNIMKGLVVKGNQLGRTIGFPTANLIPEKNSMPLPKNGVYAVRVKVGDTLYDGMVNVGYRPTLDLHNLTIEAHLFNFSDDIYGETITIYFYDYIREEQKFSGLEELKTQLAQDKIRIKNILSERMKPDPDS
jgi:riboflavin kinase / FMN adenylyltransferase